MSEKDEKPAAAAAAPPPASKGLGIVGLLLPAVFAGAAAFGGAKVSGAHGGETHVARPTNAEPPGPTISPEPFIVMTPDVQHRLHPMRVSIAIEFARSASEEGLRALTPRIRDAALTYLRTVVYEDAIDGGKGDQIRAELLARLRAAGAGAAQRVLITDLVVQ
ncbi:MAG: flagellar basal body-associated FliL family protein [Deltaproteobacteria bacterium]